MNSKKPVPFKEFEEGTDVLNTSDGQMDKDIDRKHLRELLLAGARSEAEAPIDENYFEALRNRIRAKFCNGSASHRR